MSGDAQRLINVIRSAIDQEVGTTGRGDYRYGTIDSGGGAYEVSAYLSGDETPTEGIRLGAGEYLPVGTPVVVIVTKEGDAWVDQVLPILQHAQLAIDTINGIIYLGDGTEAPWYTGEAGQALRSGGPDGRVYWD